MLRSLVIIESLPRICYVSTAVVLVSAVTHEQILTWIAVGIAVSSSCVTALIANYHRIRQAKRDEDSADRRLMLDDLRAIVRTQIEMESRMQKMSRFIEDKAQSADDRFIEIEKKTSDLLKNFDRSACRFPLPDGTAKCASLT